MSDENLFLPICGTLIFLLVLVTAIFGMRARFDFATRLHNAYTDKEKIDVWLRTYGKKQRLLLWLSLTSVLAVLILGALTMSGMLVVSTTLLIVLVVIFLVGLMAGAIILIAHERLAK